MEKETIEGNKLICKFMGYTIKDPSQNSTVDNSGIPLIDITSCKFHTCWNSLMAVVDKIEQIDERNLSENAHNFYFFISKRHTRVVYDWRNYSLDIISDRKDTLRFQDVFKDYRHSFIDFKKVDKLKSTWQAVVDFIEWYFKEHPSEMERSISENSVKEPCEIHNVHKSTTGELPTEEQIHSWWTDYQWGMAAPDEYCEGAEEGFCSGVKYLIKEGYVQLTDKGKIYTPISGETVLKI